MKYKAWIRKYKADEKYGIYFTITQEKSKNGQNWVRTLKNYIKMRQFQNQGLLAWSCQYEPSMRRIAGAESTLGLGLAMPNPNPNPNPKPELNRP